MIIAFLAHSATCGLAASSFNAVPFGLPLLEGHGVMWEDPREIHRVVVRFKEGAPALDKVRLEYWGSWWPERHLPKDREPGGADIGWLELGNWWKYDWRIADTEAAVQSNALTFTFRQVNAKEFPKVKDYPAPFRYTLKVRVASDATLPATERIEAYTDSTMEERWVRLAFEKAPGRALKLEAFNGAVQAVEKLSPRVFRTRLQVAVNSDPNTFDRTLVTVHRGSRVFTFKVDDLAQGPLFIPNFGAAVLSDGDTRDYDALAADQQSRGAKTLYERVAQMPEQTWEGAWAGMPRKKSDIYFPLGLDGGRQRFRLDANGSIRFRSNDGYLKKRPGQDTPRLELEKAPVQVRFGLPDKPVHRTLVEESLPICVTTWDVDGVRAQQTAFVTELHGTAGGAAFGVRRPVSGVARGKLAVADTGGESGDKSPDSKRWRENPAPPGDVFAVLMLRFFFTNAAGASQEAKLPIAFGGGEEFKDLRVDAEGLIWNGDKLRGQFNAETPAVADGGRLKWSTELAPRETQLVTLKIPYCVLTNTTEGAALQKLDFERERAAVANYWRGRLDASARLLTPEPMLNQFYRSHAMHLLVNCEREPGSDRRFARVGSFGYGAYGNESCMMVVDLDRRGYHKEAQDCLDAWLHYQGTVGLPGSFASKEGVLYGAGGYEAGGYNQHHGWILWMLAEHYRFTRDEAWLRRAAPGIVAGADWVIRETARTQDRHPLERGLLPAGSLEDIGDWWTWLSTSCYTWRGLHSAAWALEQIRHPDAKRLRRAAAAYHQALLNNFHKAAALAPVVRLRDGTAVPKIPSHVHRRGRCFGWICETLEGSLHLLITRAIDPRSPEATSILQDYEDNLYLSNQYGYTLDDFDQHWFNRGGMSMQACLLLDVEPYLYRDDVKHALRALFNAQAVSYFPDVRMNTEHAAPSFDDWRGDHFKSSDESNCTGWLRCLFVREEGNQLLIGQAVPREWLKPGQRCGLERTATYFGQTSVLYSGGENEITAQLDGPTRNPPKEIRLRFRHPTERMPLSITVNGKPWKKIEGDWVLLPGSIGTATVVAQYLF